ncbi:Glycine cleavage system transcriptional activator [Myxococcaceae bacterium]|nr:Glycine cleavage system transcriptional activator [Myxococcaceae bacterium]
MSYRLPPLNALRAFEAAARHLSFKNAAEELHVTPSAVSQQVKSLEDDLGMPLFQRLPRALELTPEGAAMLPKLQAGFEALAAAVARTRRLAQGGVLTVAAPPTFAQRWLMPRLAGFTKAHPEIEMRLSTSLGTIDSLDHPEPEPETDPRHAANEVAIRFGSGRYARLRADRVFGVSYTPICAPALGETLRRPEDLRPCTLIHDDTIPDAEVRPTWEMWLKLAGVAGIDAQAGPHFSNSGLAMEAAIDGLGVALAPRALATAEVAAGRLVTPFALDLPTGQAYWLVCAEAFADRPVVKSFRDWLLAEVPGGQL